MENKKVISKILVLLILIEIGITSYVSYNEYTKSDLGVCVIGNSCELVQESSYSQIFGIKVVYISMFAFTILLISYFINKKLFLIETIVGGLFAGYFIFIQIFLLKQFCSSCMVIDGLMIAITILFVTEFRLKKKRSVKGIYKLHQKP